MKTLESQWKTGMIGALKQLIVARRRKVNRSGWAILRGGPQILFCVALTACAHTPEPKIITQVVKVPVAQACVPADLILDPTYPDTDQALRSTAGPDDMLQLLAAGRLLRIQTIKEYVAALKACR